VTLRTPFVIWTVPKSGPSASESSFRAGGVEADAEVDAEAVGVAAETVVTSAGIAISLGGTVILPEETAPEATIAADIRRGGLRQDVHHREEDTLGHVPVLPELVPVDEARREDPEVLIKKTLLNKGISAF